ncbi:MAG: flagellar biosynthetic protein FliP, partial [Azoarcus sp.]|nr:flagellar biosynthetic protein FliP [Azoarcus sp.]
MLRVRPFLTVALLLALAPLAAHAQDVDLPGLPAFAATPGPDGTTTYSLSIQTLLLLTLLSFIPAMVLMTTSFTRIIIVFALLR